MITTSFNHSKRFFSSEYLYLETVLEKSKLRYDMLYTGTDVWHTIKYSRMYNRHTQYLNSYEDVPKQQF